MKDTKLNGEERVVRILVGSEVYDVLIIISSPVPAIYPHEINLALICRL